MPDRDIYAVKGATRQIDIVSVANTFNVAAVKGVTFAFDLSLGSSVDTNGPVIENVSPPPGQLGRLQPVTFDVYDAAPGILLAQIWARFSDGSEDEWIYNGNRFHRDFATNSSVVFVSEHRWTFTILPERGWSKSILNLWPVAVDASGNMSSDGAPP